MPPKPFKPPRPSIPSASKSSKSKSKPLVTGAGVSKKSKPPKPSGGFTTARIQAQTEKGGRNAVRIPSLSPDTSAVEEDIDEEVDERVRSSQSDERSPDEDEDGDDTDSPISPKPVRIKAVKSKSKAPRPSNVHDPIQNLSTATAHTPDAEDNDDDDDGREHISPALLTILLQSFIASSPAGRGDAGKKIRIQNEASAAVGKYMDTFVREAIARVHFGSEERSGGGAARGVLEVEDLEREAPQLLLDF